MSGNIEEVGFWDPNLSVRLNWNEVHSLIFRDINGLEK